MMSVTERILGVRVIPVVVVEDAERAVPLARALLEGGVPVVEVTFRTAAAAEAIRRIVREVPEVLVGAGTVLTVAQAKEAVSAGAEFVVSPGFDAEVVRFCRERRVLALPGAVTPTEIQAVLREGLTMVKFFPAEVMGGVRALKALSAPFPQVRFVPTGGISERNLGDYLALPCVAACGGSWLAEKDRIAAADWEGVREACRRTLALVKAAG